MPVVKSQPDVLARRTTKRDGEAGKVIVAEGSPLARLQRVHEDPDSGAFAGDVLDVCNQLEAKDEVVARLLKATTGKRKSDNVQIKSQDVEYVTTMLLESFN